MQGIISKKGLKRKNEKAIQVMKELMMTLTQKKTKEKKEKKKNKVETMKEIR